MCILHLSLTAASMWVFIPTPVAYDATSVAYDATSVAYDAFDSCVEVCS